MVLLLRPRPSYVQIILLPTWVLHKLYISQPENGKLAHIASKLDDFAARQQLAIEILPLGLSTLRGPSGRFGLLNASLPLSCLLGEALELGAVQCLLIALSNNGKPGWIFLADLLTAVLDCTLQIMFRSVAYGSLL